MRQLIPWRDIPVSLRRATVAIEDERFYKHKGVDYNAIVRAGVRGTSEAGDTVQGGSTITQQLVRALYINPKRNFTRKIQEAKLATGARGRALQELDPQQLPEHRPYGTIDGRTAVGVEAAAVTYFDKHVTRARPGRVGAAGRAPAGAARVQPVP